MMRQERKETGAESERVKSETRMPVAKVIEIIGNSEQSFENAIERAVDTASRSLRHITGAEALKFSVVIKDNRVAEYRVDLKIAFAIEAHELR